jgi:hypothetical protein
MKGGQSLLSIKVSLMNFGCDVVFCHQSREQVLRVVDCKALLTYFLHSSMSGKPGSTQRIKLVVLDMDRPVDKIRRELCEETAMLAMMR